MLVPIVLFIGFILFFDYVFKEVETETYNEKMIEKRREIDLIANSVDELIAKSDDWGDESYYDYVDSMVETIGNEHNVYAAVYNEQLDVSMSEGCGNKSDDWLSPLEYEDFITAVRQNDSGDVNLTVEQTKGKNGSMNLYYRWLPSGPDIENRMLLTIGVYPDCVETLSHTYLSIGMVIVLTVSFLINMAFVAFFIQIRECQDEKRPEKEEK